MLFSTVELLTLMLSVPTQQISQISGIIARPKGQTAFPDRFALSPFYRVSVYRNDES